jgi:hypothetical protein
LGTPLFAEVPSIGYIRFARVDDWQAWQGSDRAAAIAGAFPGLPPRLIYGFTGVGEAGAAFELAKFLGSRRQDLRLVRSNLLSWEGIANSDVIFVGPPKFNLQLGEIAIEQALVLESTGIRNPNPQPGEPSLLEDGDEKHALVTRIPGLHGNGEILIFASNSQGGTLAAVQYMTQGRRVEELQDRMRLPDGALPRHFQVVLKAQVKDFTPVQVDYLSHHVLKSKP